jgi:predicted dehydrogenase
MDNGARVLYNGSWCAKGQFSDWSGTWLIECEKGSLTYHRGEVTLYKATKLYSVKSTEPVKLQAPRRMGQEYVLHDFIASARTGRRPETDVYDNIHSVGMVHATVRAMKSGRRVPVLDAATAKLAKVK